MKEINSAFSQVTDIIETAKNSAYKKVNEELINRYWNIGAFLSKEAEDATFGDYIKSTGMLRDVQINAINTYFLKNSL